MPSPDTDFWLSQTRPDRELSKSLATRNEKMRRCLRLAERCAAACCPVMITGETGVGKYLVANYLHKHSPRASRPLVMAESTEFREGEVADKLLALVPAASGGTLVLRSVEQLTRRMQRELLALLREYARPESGNGETGLGRDLGVRIVSTSSTGLGNLAAPGLFQEDLFFALGEVTLRVPPLRERPEDVEHLAATALDAAGGAPGNSGERRGLSRSAKDFLRRYAFPGNISELFRMMDHAARAGGRGAVHKEDLGLIEDESEQVGGDGTPLPLEEAEKRHIHKVLLKTGWKKAATARILRITETMLNRKIRIYGLEPRG